ncbi:murein L,D-transpeptidase catalytic domain family protein [Sphingomonas sp. S1-29]|uniref:murein L,D-transpeptidase catalytic domain family protein n=1 Tax=Sphingomonas sp. S1-29 TaxID=2991074 RepID=UPI00223EF9FD|nr:murein L,D-transpeptidase catalytic domain family protein [Sphingomonas sp. S1-29]UZK70555.1 murein L,D-transpeptidase catalytic domain family protein [Sphingomonas sp. S1-29]
MAIPSCVRAPVDGMAARGVEPLASMPPAPAPYVAPEVDPRRIAGVRRPLLERALAARDTHRRSITKRDRIAVVDFGAGSAAPRMHLVDVANGRVTDLLVAHGSGSDPRHTGFLQHFSNVDGSNATSEGAYATSDYYVGKHGRSQRLLGLDPTNDNALARAIVVHGAWYAEAEMLALHGKLGRSQGCFAVGEARLQQVFNHLGEGALIYAAKA